MGAVSFVPPGFMFDVDGVLRHKKTGLLASPQEVAEIFIRPAKGLLRKRWNQRKLSPQDLRMLRTAVRF